MKNTDNETSLQYIRELQHLVRSQYWNKCIECGEPVKPPLVICAGCGSSGSHTPVGRRNPRGYLISIGAEQWDG